MLRSFLVVSGLGGHPAPQQLLVRHQRDCLRQVCSRRACGLNAHGIKQMLVDAQRRVFGLKRDG